MKKVIFSMFVLLGMAGAASAQTVTVADVEALPGETVKATLNFEAPADTYTGAQFAVQFPATGFSLAATGAVSGWAGSIEYGSMTEGKVKFAAAASKTFTEAAIEVEFTIDAAYETGEYDVTVTDIVFEGAGGKAAAEDATFKVKVVSAHTVILDEEATTAPEAAEGVNVTVKRTINANEWSTIVLPFAMSEAQVKAAFGEDVELGDFTGYDFDEDADKINVNFTAATAIEANHPYIINVSEAVNEFSAEGVDIAPNDDPRVSFKSGKKLKDFVGTFVAGYDLYENAKNTPLFLSGNKFWYATENTKAMKAFRAFFDFNDEIENKAAAESRIVIGFNNATGIANAMLNKEGNNKVIFNLSGQRVEKAQKGLFIQNGKKVIK